MKSGEQVRIYLLGEELELREMSAMSLIKARLEGRRYAAQLGGDETEQTVAAGAYVAAEGVYRGDQRVFSDGTKALEALTAEEILEIAAEYLPDSASRSDDGVPTDAATARTPLFTDGAETVERALQSGTAAAETAESRPPDAETAPEAYGRTSQPDPDLPGPARDAEYTKFAFDEADRKRTGFSDEERPAVRPAEDRRSAASDVYEVSVTAGVEYGGRGLSAAGARHTVQTSRVYAEGPYAGEAAAEIALARPRQGPETLSYFFERDSRRYDGTITPY